jgi:hypothetical protein
MVWSAMALAREMVYLGCDKFKKVNGKMGYIKSIDRVLIKGRCTWALK